MGERQTADRLNSIRADHVARYRWATERLKTLSSIIDAACGCGYGSAVLADGGVDQILAIDRSGEAIEYGAKHWGRPSITWRRCDLDRPLEFPHADAFVCFETIEHLNHPTPLLRAAARACRLLSISVPNEDVIPKTPDRFPYHKRHYRRGELERLLNETGWGVLSWWGQVSSTSQVERDVQGRTLIAEAICVG